MNTYTGLLSAIGFLALCPPATTQSVVYTISLGQIIESMDSIEDINGDGIKDLVIGQPYASFGGQDSGRITVCSGSDGSILMHVDGENSYDYLGNSVSGFGDSNGDGVPDLLIGARYFGTQNNGRAYLFSGSDGTVLWSADGENPNDFFGSSVSLVGDLNGDGISEAIVGAPYADNSGLGLTDTGRAYVLSGSDGSLLYSWYGDGSGDHFGESVAGIGDINGDGIDDVAIGAPEDDNVFFRSGSVRVFSGSTGNILIFAMNGQGDSARFGSSLAKIGDINLDSIPDILVGAYTHSSILGVSQCGAGYVMSGLDGSVIQHVEGESSSDNLGISICSTGDLNADGIDDFLVGSSNGLNVDTGNRPGYATVYSGATGSGLTNRIYGDATFFNHGKGVAGLADIDGDGFPDFAVSSYSRIKVYAGDPFLGENYCLANINTSGNLATIGGTGTSSVAANDLSLQVTGAVPNQFGIFYYGIGRTQVPFGYGWRCAGPPFRRLSVLQLDASGNGQHSFDNTPNPAIPESLKVYAGRTFNFQFWFRDPTAGGPAFNLSDAVEITFYP